jgi:hypothetical protein
LHAALSPTDVAGGIRPGGAAGGAATRRPRATSRVAYLYATVSLATWCVAYLYATVSLATWSIARRTVISCGAVSDQSDHFTPAALCARRQAVGTHAVSEQRAHAKPRGARRQAAQRSIRFAPAASAARATRTPRRVGARGRRRAAACMGWGEPPEPHRDLRRRRRCTGWRSRRRQRRARTLPSSGTMRVRRVAMEGANDRSSIGWFGYLTYLACALPCPAKNERLPRTRTQKRIAPTTARAHERMQARTRTHEAAAGGRKRGRRAAAAQPGCDAPAVVAPPRILCGASGLVRLRAGACCMRRCLARGKVV